MKEERLMLGSVPAIVYGEKSDRVYLYVHGKCGCKEEGRDFAVLAAPFGWQVLALGFPCWPLRMLRRSEACLSLLYWTWQG